MESKVVIACMGTDGGGITIFGRQVAGVWSFWTEGTTIDLDANDLEIWRSWESEPVADLAPLLPENWPLFYAETIHPEFVTWFRQAYEPARWLVPKHLIEYQQRHPHHRWMAVLGLGDPA